MMGWQVRFLIVIVLIKNNISTQQLQLKYVPTHVKVMIHCNTIGSGGFQFGLVHKPSGDDNATSNPAGGPVMTPATIDHTKSILTDLVATPIPNLTPQPRPQPTPLESTIVPATNSSTTTTTTTTPRTGTTPHSTRISCSSCSGSSSSTIRTNSIGISNIDGRINLEFVSTRNGTGCVVLYFKLGWSTIVMSFPVMTIPHPM
jgi:hypothetical protein